MSIHDDPLKNLYGEEMAASMNRATTMTSYLEQIAEEMDLSNAALSLNHFVKKNVGDPLEGHEASLWDLICSNEKWAARIRVWIAANKEPTDEEETQEILNDPRTMEALRIAKQQRAEGNLLESAVGASWAAHNQTASKGPLGSGSPNPRSVVAATPGAAPLCSNCGANPPNYCYSCWERQESPQRKAFVEAALEWGQNSLKWDKHDGPDAARALRNEAHEICVRMDAAYRAMKESER